MLSITPGLLYYIHCISHCVGWYGTFYHKCMSMSNFMQYECNAATTGICWVSRNLSNEWLASQAL